jgi:DNA-directed RNA polymerase specialized sigma24 family protein
MEPVKEIYEKFQSLGAKKTAQICEACLEVMDGLRNSVKSFDDAFIDVSNILQKAIKYCHLDLSTCDPHSSEFEFAIRIAVFRYIRPEANRINDRYKKRRQNLPDSVAVDTCSPVDEVQREDLMKRLHIEIQRLPQREGDLIRRHYVDGLSITDWATEQGLGIATAYRLRDRGIQTLSARLGAEE